MAKRVTTGTGTLVGHRAKLLGALEKAKQSLGRPRKTDEPARQNVRSFLDEIAIAALGESPAFAAREPTQCPGCGAELESVKPLFCRDYCQQAAKLVRYVRACIGDGRIADESVLVEAVGSKLLMALGGGYPTKERTVPRNIRQAVFERDAGRCECGQPATDIDHRNGNSNALEDLRAVCRACNLAAMNSAVRRVSYAEEPELCDLIGARVEDLARRIAAPCPVLACDDDAWEKGWRTVESQRRLALAALIVKQG